MYKLAIFDLDGTILDTLQDLADSLNFALQKSALPTRTTDEVCAFVGNGIRLLVERGVPQNTDITVVDRVFADFKSYYKVHCADKTKPYEGILDCLKTLHENGIKTAVVSNKADFAVQELCNQYFDGLFDFTVGEREGIRRKPAPDSVNEVLATLGIERNNAVYIGDSDVDIETARNAQMQGISVTWGFRKREFLIENGAQVLADSPKDIISYVLGK